jgi:hypothetical protein
MANGILNDGSNTNPVALSDVTDTTLYVVPANTFVVATVSMVNRHATDTASVRLAIADSATPTTADYIEFDADLVAGGVLERTGLVINAGKYLVAYTSGGSVSVMAMGIETATA